MPVGFGLTVKQVAYDRALPNFSFFYGQQICWIILTLNPMMPMPFGPVPSRHVHGIGRRWQQFADLQKMRIENAHLVLALWFTIDKTGDQSDLQSTHHLPAPCFVGGVCHQEDGDFQSGPVPWIKVRADELELFPVEVIGSTIFPDITRVARSQKFR